MRFLVLAAAVLGLCLSTARAAPEAQELGTFGDWKAYADMEGGKKICYLAIKPSKTEGGYKARGNVFLTITHRPVAKTFDVVSIVAGYQYKPDSDVAVDVGKSSWSLFTNADRAWARDAATDKAIVKSLAKAASLVAKGTSNRGTPTTDTFEMAGFGKAYKAINDACKKPAG